PGAATAAVSARSLHDALPIWRPEALGEAELDRVGGGGELGRLGAGGRLGVEDAGAVDVHPEAVAAGTGRGLGHHVEGDDAPAVAGVGDLPGKVPHSGANGTVRLLPP